MIGLGVASFGHVNDVHMQNLDTWETYAAAVRAGEVPLSRAYRPTDDERLIRELILQLKRGFDPPRLLPGQVRRGRARALPRRVRLAGGRRATCRRRHDQIVALTRDGLLRVDSLLKRFFLPQHL